MVPDPICTAQWLAPHQLELAKPHAIRVCGIFTSAYPLSGPDEHYFETRWFLPVPWSVLAQIAAFKAKFQDEHLMAPEVVVISHQEHQALQKEIGATGVIAQVAGLKVIVSHKGESFLPKPVDWAPGIKAAADVAPVLSDFATMETLLKVPDSKVLVTSHPPFSEIKAETFQAVKKLMEKGVESLLYENPKQLGVITDIEAPTDAMPEYHMGVDMAASEKLFIVPPADYEEDEDPEFELSAFDPPKTPTKVYHKSGSDEHGTPQALFDVLDQEFHFDLDVCASEAYEEPTWEKAQDSHYMVQAEPLLVPSNAKCPIYFTKETNGLAQDWFGRVWMNPPYTKGQVKVWIKKLVQEVIHGQAEFGCALVAARPDTEWFQFAVSYAYEIRFLKGRLTFEGSKDPAPFPSAILLFDKTKTVQIVRFWDWKKKLAVKYFNGPGKGGALGNAVGFIPQAPFAKLLLGSHLKK